MRVLAAILAMMLAQQALAQDVDCAEIMAQSGSQLDLNQCAEQDWMDADAALNDVYGRAREMMQNIDAELPKAERGAELALRDGQRAWISFRDATCKAEGYVMHGGSAEPMLVFGCRATLTKQRAADLELIVQEY